MLRIVALIAVVFLGGMVWVGVAWLFRPTDDAAFNRRLKHVKTGEVYGLTDVVGVQMTRMCVVRPSYAYHSLSQPEAYLSSIVEAEVAAFPHDLGTSEGGYSYLFLRDADGKVRAIKLISHWLDTEPVRNWCAVVPDVEIRLTTAGWKLEAKNARYYDVPN